MEYAFKVMTQEQAEDIAYNWHYSDDYSFYNMEADKQDLEEFLNPEIRRESMFVVTKKDEVIGFFSFNRVDPLTIDIGLGMKPNRTGRGEGEQFVKAGLEFAKSKYTPNTITLSVATFNQRAIKLYDKIGFNKGNTYMQNTNGSSFEFLNMTYDC